MNTVINHNSKRNQDIDQLEAALLDNFQPIQEELKHTFAGGIYAREMTLQAGAMITSQIHKFEHIFIVSKGKLMVWTDEGKVIIEAPFIGVTKPGTRRVARVIEAVTWTTLHRTDIKPVDDSEEAIEEAVRLIGEQIIEPHENYVLGGEVKRNVLSLKNNELCPGLP